MKKKIVIAAAFVAAIGGAVATKAAPNTTYVTLVHCSATTLCNGTSNIACGYLQTSNCQTIELKKP
jgi:hypothetical protein